ncbi:valine--tRNA ligase [Buchnera aphidicola (Macrosiphoniella sanborni)]|uniref:Valine--tRNA ligase n=1 Tax=Buchnera aphidicola (Macrosiphoniella sanborni) TaxID=1241865 RepID=A0A4D6YHQ2_9GAMM|nr:valine--tRNA ligase [Buchnera aphidicola]QCI23895.1 valine--tRNA ligase [Buchnera aphidicola (Macrosiphoniella sanborni)]
MEKNYNPKRIEEVLYNFWETNGYFKPNNKKKTTFCIMMPPPNITGSLHMGHAFQQTIMDVLIRYNRMQGKNTFWQVGTDHAGIATQILVERHMFLTEQKTKKDYSREEFIKKIWIWKKKSSDIIKQQMRRLGISVDWEYEKFTLDPEISVAVREAFIIFYQNNFIYQKKRLVHWDSKLETVVSDLEVEHRLIKGKKWFIRYPIIQNNILLKNQIKYLVIATTRPETLLGDTAIAINPKDMNNNFLIGQFAMCPLINRVIPIIGDEYANLDKDTGCVKITPAHDFNDYKVGVRHHLPMINIFTLDGRIKSVADVYNYKGKKSHKYSTFIPYQFQKLNILSARTKIVNELSKLGLLEKIEESDIIVPYSDRSDVIIEPMLTNQWYLKTSKLAQEAIYAVKDKKIKFIPKKYESMYLSWMNNIEDWCISRQLWWGHQIPVWYDDKKNIYVGHNEEEIRLKYSISKNISLIQEEDVLDTWFSSGLWTFSTLGWPKKTKFLKIFHPTNVIVSGFDIIFFWIARMIMLTMYFIKDKHNNPEVPFKNIYITGLIRDEYGQKMSKSKGNVIDPLDMIDGISINALIKKRTKNLFDPKLSKKIVESTLKQFPEGIASTGTDALRFTFLALASSTRDIKWDMSRLQGYRNFCNKLWNASRFVLQNTENHNFLECDLEDNMLLINKWILIKLNNTIKLYRKSLDTYRFDIASNTLYDFIWNIFCDWYLEFVKIVIKTGSDREIYLTKNVLLHVLESFLKLTHPIMPFITETIWQRIKLIKNIKSNTIMLENFPKYKKELFDQKILINMNWIKKIIVFLRNIRVKMNISRTKLLPIFLYNVTHEKEKIIIDNLLLIKSISFLDSITILVRKYNEDLCVKEIIDEVEILIPILKLIDKEVELKRLKQEEKKIKINLLKIQENISNKNFMKFAPNTIVTKEKNRLLELKKTWKKLSDQIKLLQNLSS